MENMVVSKQLLHMLQLHGLNAFHHKAIYRTTHLFVSTLRKITAHGEL